ncbi:MAG: hypothetical protein JWL83_4673 [Actinomycetia bacterium]|nr:hypothetical protein [Actinomycetes bacterium]
MSNARRRPKSAAQRKRKPVQRRSSNRPGRGVWIIVALVIVIAAAAVASFAGGSTNSPSGGGDQPAPASLVAKVRSVPAGVFDTVGVGSAIAAPKKINGAPLTAAGKPHIVYIGAEYCPYCATERWPMVVALSRFGTFSGLKTTHSSSTDVYPNTQTFSFHGATYSSQWISFSGVETQSNVRQGNGYAPLDTPTASERQLFSTYDSPPYVSSSAAGGIPFIDFAGKFLTNGVTYDPGVLKGKTAAQIATALSDPTTKISQGAIGVANTFIAAICSITHNQPANVCTPTIQRIEAGLK